jgi:hypothetical protein
LALHAVNWQVPVPHEATALANVQGVAQAPQCVSVSSRCSQPFAPWPSQLPKPALQLVTAQTPPLHAPVPLLNMHALPQRPQCATESVTRTSQPSDGIALQFSKPRLQAATLHVPAAQAAVPFATVQPRPQAPQCASETLVSVSHPLLELPSQLPRFGSHEPSMHAPAAHVAEAPG